MEINIISHRGNLCGKSINNVVKSITTLNNGFDCEIDVWMIANTLFFGHDAPQDKLNMELLDKYRGNLLIHCKNYEALSFFSKTNYEFFAHENDKYAFTSKGRCIVFPGQQILDNCIVMLPELGCDINSLFLYKNITICTDYPILYKQLIEKYND